jgi:hypothetical protein
LPAIHRTLPEHVPLKYLKVSDDESENVDPPTSELSSKSSQISPKLFTDKFYNNKLAKSEELNTPGRTALEVSERTALLVALATGWRPGSDLACISWSHCVVAPDGIHLVALRPKEGALKEVFLRRLPPPQCLLPCGSRRNISASDAITA